LSVDYQIKGSATNRSDFAYLTGNTIIPPFTNQVTVAVQTHQDCIIEQAGGEQLELELITDQDETYHINQKTARTLITDFICNQSFTKSNCERPASMEENNTEEEPEEVVEPEEVDEPEEVVDTSESTVEQINENNQYTTGNTFETLGNIDVKGTKSNTDDNEEIPENETNSESTTCKNESLFYTYPWLKQLVNLSQCNEEKITLFINNNYAFLLLENGTEKDVYYQDGSYYCSQNSSFDCLSYYKNLYNLKEEACWRCEAVTEPCSINGCTNNSACNFNPNACIDDGSCEYGNLVCDIPCDCSVNNNEPLAPDWFNLYPVLFDIVDVENCVGTNISIFDKGNFAYIAVADANGTALYLDYLDATPFCVNQTNYNCLSLYDLAVPTQTWQCTGNTIKQADESSTPQKNLVSSIEVFPNPNIGLFRLFFHNAIPTQVNIYSLDGKHIRSINTEVNQILQIDLTDNNNGIYLVEAIYEGFNEIQKLVVH